MASPRSSPRSGTLEWKVCLDVHATRAELAVFALNHRADFELWRPSAHQFGFGAPAVFTREGGSIGAVPSMEGLLGAPVVFLGLSLPEHGNHAPNEFFDWQRAAGGIAVFAHTWATLEPSARPRRLCG